MDIHIHNNLYFVEMHRGGTRSDVWWRDTEMEDKEGGRVQQKRCQRVCYSFQSDQEEVEMKDY